MIRRYDWPICAKCGQRHAPFCTDTPWELFAGTKRGEGQSPSAELFLQDPRADDFEIGRRTVPAPWRQLRIPLWIAVLLGIGLSGCGAVAEANFLEGRAARLGVAEAAAVAPLAPAVAGGELLAEEAAWRRLALLRDLINVRDRRPDSGRPVGCRVTAGRTGSTAEC